MRPRTGHTRELSMLFVGVALLVLGVLLSVLGPSAVLAVLKAVG